MATCVPTDQAASTSATQVGPGTDGPNTDEAISSTCSGIRKRVTISITWAGTITKDPGTAAVTLREYSINNGSDWNIATSGAGSGTWVSGDLGSVNIGIIKVRVSCTASVPSTGDAACTSDISAWSISYRRIVARD